MAALVEGLRQVVVGAVETGVAGVRAAGKVASGTAKQALRTSKRLVNPTKRVAKAVDTTAVSVMKTDGGGKKRRTKKRIKKRTKKRTYQKRYKNTKIKKRNYKTYWRKKLMICDNTNKMKEILYTIIDEVC